MVQDQDAGACVDAGLQALMKVTGFALSSACSLLYLMQSHAEQTGSSPEAGLYSLVQRESVGLQEAEAGFKYAHAPAYLKYLRDRLTVNFVRLDQAAKADVQPLQVELLRTSTYEETCRALAAALQVCAGPHRLLCFLGSRSQWVVPLGLSLH